MRVPKVIKLSACTHLEEEGGGDKEADGSRVDVRGAVQHLPLFLREGVAPIFYRGDGRVFFVTFA